MKKGVLFIALGLTLGVVGTVRAQSDKEEKKKAKKEAAESRREKHKQFWTKVGQDQRDFWKGEHEKHVARKKERDEKRAAEKGDSPAGGSEAKEDRRPPKPPKPFNPFKRKKKEEA